MDVIAGKRQAGGRPGIHCQIETGCRQVGADVHVQPGVPAWLDARDRPGPVATADPDAVGRKHETERTTTEFLRFVGVVERVEGDRTASSCR